MSVGIKDNPYISLYPKATDTVVIADIIEDIKAFSNIINFLFKILSELFNLGRKIFLVTSALTI